MYQSEMSERSINSANPYEACYPVKEDEDKLEDDFAEIGGGGVTLN